MQARVVRVVDGDTIIVLIDGREYTLRYIGVDTPETVHPERPVEPYGPEASAANKAMVEGKTVYLEKDVSETDRFGRLLRYVYLDDGTFVNAELVRQGYAQAVTFPPDVKYEELLRSLQREAMEAGRGLWSLATAQPPTAPPPAAGASVVIAFVYYDGLVPLVESDEYAEIRNDGNAPINLEGWRLNAGAPGQDFVFPDFVLEPGQACRIYTDEVHPETCGFSFRTSQPIWTNSGDCGTLFDAADIKVFEYCYSGN